MKQRQSLRFGGVFGGVGRPVRKSGTDSKEVVVRPSGFEPPTFCSGGKESMCILLIYMTAMTCFKANRRRIQAAVDERLMKSFFEEPLFKITSSTPFPPPDGRV